MLQSSAPVSDFRRLLQNGNHHAQQGQLIVAERYYQQAIAANPRSAIAHQNLAELLRQQHRFDEANQYYRQAIALRQVSTHSFPQTSSPTKQENLTMNMMSSPAPETLTYLQQAFDAIEQQSWAKAIILAQQELQQHPDSSVAYWVLGQARQASQQLSQAQQCYQRAVTLDDHNIDALVGLADLYARQEKLAQAVATYQEAIAYYRRQTPAQSLGKSFPVPPPMAKPAVAETMKPEVSHAVEPEVSHAVDVEALLQAAATKMAEQQWDGAIALLQKAVAEQPDADTYQRLGNAFQASQQLEAAVQAYVGAVKLRPDFAEAYANLGTVYAKLQQWDRAIQAYKKAVALKPDAAGIYRNLGKIFEQLGEQRRATECWYRAFTLEPDRVTAEDQVRIGDRFSVQQEWDQAVACYRLALQQDNQLLSAYLGLGQVLEHQGNWSEAIAVYRQLLRIHPTVPGIPEKLVQALLMVERSPASVPVVSGSRASHAVDVEALLQAAATKMAEQQWDGAIALLQKAVAEQPDADTYQRLGNAFQASQQLEAAVQAYVGAVKLRPDFAEAYANLGTVYAKLQQWHQAISAYRKAVELKPDAAGIYRNLGKIFEQLGEQRRATECWYRAFTLEPDRVTAEDQVRIGDRFSVQQEWDQAVACYRLALQQDNQLLSAYLGLGQVLEHQGNWSEAIAVYRQLLRIHPTVPGIPEKLVQALLMVERSGKDTDVPTTSVDSMNGRGTVTSEASHGLGHVEQTSRNWEMTSEVQKSCERGTEALTAQDWNQAIGAFREAIAIDPDSVQALNGWGEALQQLGQWDEAATIYRRLTELEPESFLPWAKLGDVWMAMEQFESAADAYRQVTKLNPDFFWGHNGLGDALRHLERWQEAAVAYQQGIAINDEFFWSQNNLGDMLMQAGQPEQAVGVYRRAIALDGKAKGLHGKLGKALRETSQVLLQEAMACYRQEVENYPDDVGSYHLALELNPNDGELYGQLGDTLAMQGDVNQAIAFYQVGLQVAPEDGALVARLGQVAERQEKWTVAVEHYRQAVKLCPQQGEYFYRLGQGLERLGQQREAASMYRQAAILSPDLGDVHERLARLLMVLEEWDGAVMACRRAVELNGENSWLFKLLGDLYVRLGQVDEASNAYRRAIQLGYRDF